MSKIAKFTIDIKITYVQVVGDNPTPEITDEDRRDLSSSLLDDFRTVAPPGMEMDAAPAIVEFLEV